MLACLLLVGCGDTEGDGPTATPEEPAASASIDDDTAARVTAISATADAAARQAASAATRTRAPEPTATSTKPESTPTATLAPTATPTHTPTATPEPPTPTPTEIQPTNTPEPPTATPTPEVFSFGEGVMIVGQDVPPGTYRSSGPDGGLYSACYWERLAGFSGQLQDIIANEFADYRQVVTIKEGDVGFNSEGCGRWSADLGPITASPTDPFGDGVWIVNVDIAPGTWRSETPPTGGCYWERTSGFGGELAEIIANEFTDAQQIVTIAPSDVGFKTSGCGTWTYVGG